MLLLQIPFHGIDPVLLDLGPIQLRWYGLMYVFGFIVAYFVMRRAIRQRDDLRLTENDLFDLLFYLILGVMIGGRLGYILLYDLSSYLENPASIVAVWRGGMSFHGGLIGAFLSALLITWRRGWNFLVVADLGAIGGPIGLGLGRIGNFINGELFGRETSLPWAMLFPGGGNVGRHPSQLYEAVLEGAFLFLFVAWVYRRRLAPGAAFWAFLAGYGAVRFLVEFVREPDAHIGIDLGPFTRGQLLSLPLLVIGTVLLVRRWRMPATTEPAAGSSAFPPRRRGQRRPRNK
jgi:phosphatidylglycerol:prolipoprotein diacylglycerol transferase